MIWKYLDLQKPDRFKRIQQQRSVLCRLRREFIRKPFSFPVRAWVEVKLDRIPVAGVAVCVHKHFELLFFRVLRVEDKVAVLVIDLVAWRAVVKSHLGRMQVDPLEINGRVKSNCEDTEEWIIEIDLDEVLVFILQVRQQ